MFMNTFPWFVGFYEKTSMMVKLMWLQVREAVSILDLDVMFYPCPAGGPTWREKVKQKGGKASFPYMVDPNTGLCLLRITLLTRM